MNYSIETPVRLTENFKWIRYKLTDNELVILFR